MKNRRSIATLALVAMLSGCGSDSGGLGSAPQPTPGHLGGLLAARAAGLDRGGDEGMVSLLRYAAVEP